MKKIKIEKTGLCIFLLSLPLIIVLISAIVLAAVLPLINGTRETLMTASTVIAVVSVILIFIYLYRTGPALASLILIARVKKSAAYDDESLHETSLYDFVKLMRKPSPEPPDETDASGENGDGADDNDNAGNDEE